MTNRHRRPHSPLAIGLLVILISCCCCSLYTRVTAPGHYGGAHVATPMPSTTSGGGSPETPTIERTPTASPETTTSSSQMSSSETAAPVAPCNAARAAEIAPMAMGAAIQVRLVVAESLLEPDAVVPPGTRPRVLVATNLPDGTRLMVELAGAGFRGQSRMEVAQGCAVSEAFAGSTGLVPGRYRATVTMPIAEAQPSAVREVVGQRGELLRGPLVRRSRMGTTLEAVAPFAVGGNDAIDAVDDAREHAEHARHVEVRALIGAGRSMRSLRERGHEVACGERMRDLQRRVRRVEATTPTGAGGDLAVLGALPTLFTCVSCVDDRRAHDACDQSDTALRDWPPRR